MFKPQSTARVFSIEPGVDLPMALIKGLETRLEGHPPESWARVEIFVNTRRMQRRIKSLFTRGPARLLPRIRTISDLGLDISMMDIPQPISPLRRRLELSQLVSQLLDQAPELAPRTSLFDLADSLANLMDEMQGEGVQPSALQNLDVGELSGHWQRSLQFLDIIERFFGTTTQEEPDVEAHQRLVIERLVNTWKNTPPDHPILVAGSTGSRGATALFMRAVARLPQGAVVLPGFDTELPSAVWERLENPLTSEDHPQFRFAKLLDSLALHPTEIPQWEPSLRPFNAQRNQLISLALRPAPVTDQWLAEGQNIDQAMIHQMTKDLTLIEAPSPRVEAVAIALRLREAVANGQKAAVISPDRTLTRQVTAALRRWNIEPDDSAGRPLDLSAPGRFLRHISELFGHPLNATALLTILKHPLCSSGNMRGDHLRWTRDLELEVLRRGLPFPYLKALTTWVATKHKGDQARLDWVTWIMHLLGDLGEYTKNPLSKHLENLINLSQTLAAGPSPASDKPSGNLWEKAAGREAKRVVDALFREAPYGGSITPSDFRDLLRSVLSQGEVRDPISPHPDVMIWGTMEARVQGADLVILAGLNDGTWPKLPAPDPWLNRKMRHKAGLLLPDRRIGLSAHDFQQAIAAKNVVLTRAIRNAESETIASRWLLRLTSLLTGLPNGGEEVLNALRARGQKYLDLAKRLDDRVGDKIEPAPRPSPRPPIKARPTQLSVTRISQLVRDPYAIYCEQILKLRALDPIQRSPDAPLRGTVLHSIVEKFIESKTPPDHQDAKTIFLDIADQVLETHVPWPAARILWHAKLALIADSFLRDEVSRRELGSNLANEVRGSITLGRLGFTLSAMADRIDQLEHGGFVIYDYKSGTIPSPKDQKLFNKQLELEAVIARSGGFNNLDKRPVSHVAYISLGKVYPFKLKSITDEEIDVVQGELETLIGAYQTKSQGYTALRLDPKLGFPSDFQHLSRFGEWDIGQMPEPEDVG